MSEVIKFYGEGQARIHNVVPYNRPIAEEKVAPVEKVTPSEDVKKGLIYWIIWKSKWSRSI